MSKFKPMLAGKVQDPASLKYPVIVSPKIDGIRAIVKGGVVLSRKLLPIPNAWVQKTFGRPEFEGLDGELIVGSPVAKNVCRQTQSFTARADGKGTCTFYVFDTIAYPEDDYQLRLEFAGKRVSAAYSEFCELHQSKVVQSVEELLFYEETCVLLGYEGVIVRAVDGPYKYGRSTDSQGWLLKFKRFEDSEAEILEVIEGETNTNEAKTDELGHSKRSSAQDGKVKNGVMGALRVRDIHTGVEFNIGTGFDAQDTWWFWEVRSDLIGKIVKYKFQPVGVKEKPRFPVYLGIRSPEDTPEAGE